MYRDYFVERVSFLFYDILNFGYFSIKIDPDEVKTILDEIVQTKRKSPENFQISNPIVH